MNNTEAQSAPTKEQLHILQHSLGLDDFGKDRYYKDGREYYGFMPNRNHFCAGGKDADTCREMVALGWMTQHVTTEVFRDYNCSVTEAGKDVVRQQSPKPPNLTRSQERYRRYLRLGDLFENFKDFLDYEKEMRHEGRATW